MKVFLSLARPGKERPHSHPRSLAQPCLVQSEDGSILVELALCLSVVTVIFASMANYAVSTRRAIVIQGAASAAAAYGTIPGNATDTNGMLKLAYFDATGSTTGSSGSTNIGGYTATAAFFYACTPGSAHVTAATNCPAGAPLQYAQVTTNFASNGVLGTFSTLHLTGTATYRVLGTP